MTTPAADKTLRELHAARPKRPPQVAIAQWFEQHLDKSNRCWIWTRGRYSNGYGKLWTPNGHVLTHRFAYELWRGQIPEGSLVCHKCDNPPCCNPDHLFLGTYKDNICDSIKKGRFQPGNHTGERNGGCKLSKEKVLLIRSSNERTSFLMARFKVSKATIQRIRSGKSWRTL